MENIAFLLEHLANRGDRMSSITTNAFFETSNPYPIVFLTASSFHKQETIRRQRGLIISHQILLILDGKGILRTRDQMYELKKGSAFYTGPLLPVEYIDEGGLVSAFLTVAGTAADELSASFSRDGFLFCESVDPEPYLSTINQLISEYQSNGDQGRLSTLAYSFFVDFFAQNSQRTPEWLENVIHYIHRNFAKKLTLEELARAACVSVSKLCHDFKEKYGLSVFQYILDIRLRYAHNILITSSGARTKDVAALCGFHDIGYFCKAYRSKFGKTPTQTSK